MCMRGQFSHLRFLDTSLVRPLSLHSFLGGSVFNLCALTKVFLHCIIIGHLRARLHLLRLLHTLVASLHFKT